MRPSIRIAAAQSISVPGDIAANVLVHTRFIAAAQRAAVDLLIFPELSLSGYELPRLRRCAVTPDDPRLDPIRNRVRDRSMTVVVGAPLESEADKPSIGAIAFFPDGTTSVYRKQYLHGGESAYAVPGTRGSGCPSVRGESVALAIGADTSHDEHAARAAADGASLYLAGVLFSEGNAPRDAGALQHHAAAHAMGVLAANHGAPSGGYVSAGKCAFWAPGGELVVTAPGAGSLLVVASKTRRGWSGEVLAVGPATPRCASGWGAYWS